MDILLLYALALLISVLFTRWVFSIGTMLRFMKAQTQLLAEIAEKQGVEGEKINKILAPLKTKPTYKEYEYDINKA